MSSASHLHVLRGELWKLASVECTCAISHVLLAGCRRSPTSNTLNLEPSPTLPRRKWPLEANSSSAALKRGIEEDLVIYAEASKRLLTRIRVDH